MNECEAIGKKYLPVTRAESLNNTCLIDFKDPELKQEVEDLVMCEDRCSFEEDYEECMETCLDTIDKSVAGSIVVDKQTLEIKESTIPVSCSLFFVEEENGHGTYVFSLERQEEILKQLEKAGCDAMDGGWMHPHEFVPEPVEIEEEYPAICYVHVKSKGEGKCRLPVVLQILGMQKQQASLDAFIETV